MQRTTMAFPRIRESRGPVYGSGPSGGKHPAIRRERTPGELALGDLRPSSDAESASRTLARYAAIRFAWLALERAPMLDDERTAAAEYTAFAAQILDASSRASLQRLLELGADSPPLEGARCLQRAGSDAAAQGALCAAASCWRLAYRVAVAGGEWAAGERAAASLARMAEGDGAVAAAEIWAHRARRMRKRLEA